MSSIVIKCSTRLLMIPIWLPDTVNNGIDLKFIVISICMIISRKSSFSVNKNVNGRFFLDNVKSLQTRDRIIYGRDLIKSNEIDISNYK